MPLYSQNTLELYQRLDQIKVGQSITFEGFKIWKGSRNFKFTLARAQGPAEAIREVSEEEILAFLSLLVKNGVLPSQEELYTA